MEKTTQTDTLYSAILDQQLALASNSLNAAKVDANFPKVRTSAPPAPDDSPSLPFNHLG